LQKIKISHQNQSPERKGFSVAYFRCRKRHVKASKASETDRHARIGHSVDAQVRQLTKAGCKKVVREVASGARADRAQLSRALNQLAPATC
jgi:hypothetical protein